MKRPLSFEVRRVRRGIMRKTLQEGSAPHDGAHDGGHVAVTAVRAPQQELCATAGRAA